MTPYTLIELTGIKGRLPIKTNNLQHEARLGDGLRNEKSNCCSLVCLALCCRTRLMQESRKLSKTKHITILPFNSCHVYFFLLHPAFVHFVRSFSRLLYHSCLLFFLFFLSLYLLVSPSGPDYRLRGFPC